jgi:hypothetical protein
MVGGETQLGLPDVEEYSDGTLAIPSGRGPEGASARSSRRVRSQPTLAPVEELPSKDEEVIPTRR